MRLCVLLAAALLAGCSNPAAITTGLAGVVVRGPVTPVCTEGVPCDAPFSATFDVRAEGRVVGAFTSSASGAFSVALRPGSYEIVPRASAPLMNPTAQRRAVTVEETGITTVRLAFDTGIR